jgi:integrase
MARTSDIWWRDSKDCYYTTLDGKQKRLCKTLKESRTKLQQILRGQEGITTTGVTFAYLADQFLQNSLAENEKDTFDVHKLFLQSFVDFVGKKRQVARLCEADLDNWCRAQTSWGENTGVRAKAIVLATLNYGLKKLGLPSHPLIHVRPGTVTSRDRYLTEMERQRIRTAVKGVFADYILALEQTGARPFSEICKVTAADVNLENATWTLAKWKNSRKKKGVKRVIYLTDAMLELTKRLMAKYPEGPLFRNATGSKWSRQSITWRFRQLGQKLGIEGLTAYVVRHGFITDALARGVPVAVVAELCGTSIQTINRRYAHLDQKADVLREALRQAVG